MKKMVLEAMKSHLQPLGFRLKGSTFWRERDELIHLINLQSSTTSTATHKKVTINIGVVFPHTLHSWDSPHSVWSAQWRARLGELSPSRSDEWWHVQDPDSARDVAKQIVMDLEAFGLPKLSAFSSVSSLLTVLEKGEGRGHSVTHQKKLADRIKGSLDNQSG